MGLLATAFVLILAIVKLSKAAIGNPKGLPTVDLGYGKQQALLYDIQNDLYNFSNIRYAQAPIGNLRWAPPLEPIKNSSIIENGHVGRVCPQAFPIWYLRGKQILAGNPNATSLSASDILALYPADPRETEDCLFLDVLVPRTVFQKRDQKKKLAPVIIWFYGGGFTFSYKGNDGDPTTIIESSQKVAGSNGIIYVAFNYRSGAFGFLGGSNLQSNGSANVGLLDQRLALQWVTNHIHKFGGDKGKVTVLGQSAGAGSIMHQITAYGGLNGEPLFQQAVLQSPGFQPYPSNFQQDELLQTFLAGLNVTTINEARDLSYDELQSSNINIVSHSPYGSFTFSPTVDGAFVPAPPGKLVLQGSFHRNLSLILSHNAHETIYFVDPSSVSQADYIAGIHAQLPDAQPSVISHLTDVLYPYIFNGSYPYKNPYELRVLSSAEVSFTCNTRFLAAAFADRSWAYRFSIPPAYHGQDVAYTYFNASAPTAPTAAPINATIAFAMQSYITQFAVTGNPNGPSVPDFPGYGVETNVLDLSVAGIEVISDDEANVRCEWWQKALYF